MSSPAQSPFALDNLEACRHTIAVLELEKAKHKINAKILALRLTRAERLLKQARKPEDEKGVGNADTPGGTQETT